MIISTHFIFDFYVDQKQTIRGRIKTDFHGFQIIMNLLIMPLFFLSSAFFPISDSLPTWLKTISYANPLFYMVDGMRGSLTGVNNIFPPVLDFVVVFSVCLVMMGLGSYFFSKSEA